MAIRARIRTGAGQLPVPDPVVIDKDGKVNTTGLSQLKQAVQGIVRKLNGTLTLGDGTAASWAGNVDGQYIDVVFPGAADTEIEIPHGLGRVVVGYMVVRKDKAADIYESNSGSWNTERMLLKSSVASATVRLLIW